MTVSFSYTDALDEGRSSVQFYCQNNLAPSAMINKVYFKLKLVVDDGPPGECLMRKVPDRQSECQDADCTSRSVDDVTFES